MIKLIRLKYIIASSVAAVTFLVYLPSLQNGFVNWDDNVYVYSNLFIRSFNVQLLKSAFLEFHIGHWHPLTWLSHACDYALWGLNPLGHHLTNNILHTLNTFLVVILIIRLLEVYQEMAGPKWTSQQLMTDRTAKITAAATGLLFGLHPLHVESVAWVSDRKDLLCAFFYLLTLITYTSYLREIRAAASINARSLLSNKKYLSLLTLCILALLSKEMAVSLPFVLLILDWYPSGRIHSLKSLYTSTLEKLPFLTLAFLTSNLAIAAQQFAGAMKYGDTIPWGARVLVACKSLIVYLSKMIVPYHLVPLYPLLPPMDMQTALLDYVIPLIMVPAITAACFVVIRKHKTWLAIWAYYVITLVPVLGLVQAGIQAMADRYTYLPSLGPFLLIGLASAKVYDKVTTSDQWGMALRMASVTIAMTVFVFLSYATIRQTGIWKDGVVFWNYIIDKEPEFRSTAYINLVNAYADKGMLDQAIVQFQNALSMDPDNADLHNTIGFAYLSQGQTDAAIEHFQTALRLNPDSADAHFYLGSSYLQKGSKTMAREEFELGLTLQPDNYMARQILSSINAE